MADENPHAGRELGKAIGIATHLLTIAAENGKTIEPDIAVPIAEAVQAAQHGTLPPQVGAAFWKAFSRLSQLVQPVSAASFAPEYLRSAKSQQRAYTKWAVGLLLVLVPLSICAFIVSTLNGEITSLAAAICGSEPALQCDRSSPLAAQPVPTAELKHIQDVNYAVYVIYKDLRSLNLLMLRTPAKANGVYKCYTRDPKAHDPKPSGRKSEDCPKEHADEDVDYAHSFEAAVYLARDLRLSSERTYGVLGAYVLPSLYAMLGACAFGLRNLLNARALTVASTAASAPLVRLVLAALVGFIVGLFTDFTKTLSPSPLAAAFLVGYALEIFFSFLDTMIEATKPAAKSAPTSS
jgi:hypothetical protein